VLNEVPSQEVIAMWDSFSADVAQHFQDDEANLAKAGYPATVQYASQHRALVESC
jgi:hemerythrin